MSGEVHRIADFTGNAVGHRIALRTAVASTSFLLFQTSDGSAALYVGFTEDGLLKVNCEHNGAWQQERQLPLPLHEADEIALTFDIMHDHVLIGVEDRPWLAARLGAEAEWISAVLFNGTGSHVVSAGRHVHRTRWETLTGEWPASAPKEYGVGVVLVATRWIHAAVAEALKGDLPVVVAAPFPWQIAELVTRFDNELEGGKLRAIAAWPADADGMIALKAEQVPYATPEVLVRCCTLTSWRNALGHLQVVYCDEDRGGLTLPAAISDIGRRVAIWRLMECSLLPVQPGARFRLVRASGVGQNSGKHWLPPAALPNLARSSMAANFLTFIEQLK